MQYQDVWGTSIESRSTNLLKAKSDLLDQITRRLKSINGDRTERLGINVNRYEDLKLGKIDKFRLTELESIARRVGIHRQ